jgi:hypothetical protein
MCLLMAQVESSINDIVTYMQKKNSNRVKRYKEHVRTSHPIIPL